MFTKHMQFVLILQNFMSIPVSLKNSVIGNSDSTVLPSSANHCDFFHSNSVISSIKFYETIVEPKPDLYSTLAIYKILKNFNFSS